MISQALNDQITRIGPNTEAGAVLRHYWQPAALVEELAHGDRVPVNLMGERLALIRNDAGDLVLATREASPDEAPTHYPDAADIRIKPDGTTYPVVEKKGAIFAYLGPGAPPEFPNYDCFRAPDSHVFAFKGLWECNWLQALEIGMDPAHASFLHRFLKDDDPEEGYGQQFRDKVADTNIPMTRLMREYPRPDITVAETEYGLSVTSLRRLKGEMTHVRVTNAIFPEAITIPMSREMILTQWHVPIDDENCYWFTIFTSFKNPVDKALMREQRLKEHSLPTYAPLKNKANNYHYDPQEQATLTYTGMGLDINVHDQWAVEGMGPIQDRTQEHLGRSDVVIIRYRKMLRKAIAAIADGRLADLPMYGDLQVSEVRGPLTNDAITAEKDWQSASLKADADRRAACPWDAAI